MSHTASRRSFLAAAAMLSASIGLAACASDSGRDTGADQDTGASPSWSATQDDSLDCLTMQVAGGNVVAMTGDGWTPRDGFVQLQLSGGSIPGQSIEAVWRDGAVLNVRLGSGDKPSTLDLMLTEYRLESSQAEVDAVESVKVDYGNGDVQEIQRAYE